MTRLLQLRLGLEKVLRKQLDTGKDQLKDSARADMLPGDRLGVPLPNGERFATVSLVKGATTANVTDEDAFFDWVAENRPDQIETVTRVRPGFAQAVTDQAKKDGAAVDKTTGETIPGVTLGQGEPHPKVDLVDGAHELVAEAWRDGSLTEHIAELVQPQLPDGEEEGDENGGER